MPYAEPQGLAPGAVITSTGMESNVPAGDELLGRWPGFYEEQLR